MAVGKVVANTGKGLFDDTVKVIKKAGKGVKESFLEKGGLGIGKDDAVKNILKERTGIKDVISTAKKQIKNSEKGLAQMGETITDYMKKNNTTRDEAIKALNFGKTTENAKAFIKSKAEEVGKANAQMAGNTMSAVGKYYFQGGNVRNIARSAMRIGTTAVAVGGTARVLNGKGTPVTNDKGEFDIAGIPFV